VAYESRSKGGALRGDDSLETDVIGAKTNAKSNLGRSSSKDQALPGMLEETSMPVLKIVKPLGKEDLDLLITAWCVRIWKS
jgi:hypothetical protein